VADQPSPPSRPRSRKRGRHGAPAPEAASAQPRSTAQLAAPPVASPEPPRATRAPIRDTQSPPAHLPRESRSEARNAAIRATLTPYEPGERPWIIVVCSLLAIGLGLGELVAWLAGATIGGKHPGAGGIVAFTVVFVICGLGMWQMWYGAVLGFMALMAIVAVLFTLFLIEASNVYSALVALGIILVSGYLFFKLVRVLSRIQMPRPPQGRPGSPPR
jgi:hypothetical protein